MKGDPIPWDMQTLLQQYFTVGRIIVETMRRIAGAQNPPNHSALLALHALEEEFTPERFTQVGLRITRAARGLHCAPITEAITAWLKPEYRFILNLSRLKHSRRNHTAISLAVENTLRALTPLIEFESAA